MLLWLAGAVALAAIAAAAELDARRRAAPTLPAAPAHHPETVVLVPMRDEEHNAAACVTALAALASAPRVVVIDDGSSDRTRAIVEELARAAPQVHAESARPLPAGWRGKVNALAGACEHTTEPWILTTDADARLAPDVLARAHAAAAGRGLDAVSLAGTQEARGLGEQLLVPAVFALLDAMLGDWSAAADGRGAAVANGQFILVRRAALEASGGFAAIRRPAIDDVALAQALRAGGFRTGFLRAPGLLRIRMYEGFAAALAGWRRNLGGIFGPAPRLAAVALVALLGPVALLAACASLGAWPACWLLWTGGAAASVSARLGSEHAPWTGLLYPLDAALLAALLALGVADFRRGRLGTWKGRVFDVGPADPAP